MSTYEEHPPRTQTGGRSGGTITPPGSPVGFAFYVWLTTLATALLVIVGVTLWTVATAAPDEYHVGGEVAVAVTFVGALGTGAALWVFLRLFRRRPAHWYDL